MPFDPQVQVVLENIRKQGIPPLHTLSVDNARQKHNSPLTLRYNALL